MKKKLGIIMGVLLVATVAVALLLSRPPAGAQPPASWPTAWTGLGTDPDEGGCDSHRNLRDMNGDGHVFYYATDAHYLYLRMETESAPGWPSGNVARYKWFLSTNGTPAHIQGGTAYDAEFLLMLEDYTGDRLGELTLLDDLSNVGFSTRWMSGNTPYYTTNNPRTPPNPSLYWQRVVGNGTPGTGGPQGVIGTHIGYRIDNAATGGNFVDMYVSWAALGDPDSLCILWSTDNQNPNLDQAPTCDRPTQDSCLSITVPRPPSADFHASNTNPCVNETITFFDDSTRNPTSWYWTFGDGGTSTAQDATHSYDVAGKYTVSLTVSNAYGSDTKTRTEYMTVHACTTYYKDADGDGYGVTGDTKCLCAPSGDYDVTIGGDCDDTNASVYPGATEVCNGIDDDCDDQIDEEDASGCTTYYKDADGDGYGVTGDRKCLCAPSGDYNVTIGGDCDDTDADANPDAEEACDDGKDNDCDEDVDCDDSDCSEDDACKLGIINGVVFYDADGDGEKDPSESGIAGVTVELYEDDGDEVFDPEWMSGSTDALVDTMTTDKAGVYLFSDLELGLCYWVYVVEDTLPPGVTLAIDNPIGPICLDQSDPYYYEGDFPAQVAPLPPVGGTAYPVNKLAILLPWIALAAVIAGALIYMRRRQAES